MATKYKKGDRVSVTRCCFSHDFMEGTTGTVEQTGEISVTMRSDLGLVDSIHVDDIEPLTIDRIPADEEQPEPHTESSI